MVVLTILGIWVAFKIPVSLNVRDSADRLAADRTARFEGDIGRINQLLSGVLGEEGADHVVPKRSAARAVAEYAQQGRVYAPATTILLHYLEKEGDAKTHCYLHASIDRGLSVKPPALGVGARSGDGVALDQGNWETLRATERARLRANSRDTDTADCAAITEPAVVTAPPISPPVARVSEFSQYFDVDCNRVNGNSALNISLDSTLALQYKIQSATAEIRNPSNLKDARASIIKIAPDSVTADYAIVGLDRQLFGNCPGGGHGTLVITFHLEPK